MKDKRIQGADSSSPHSQFSTLNSPFLKETWGRGIEKIFDACAAAGLPEPRYGDTGDTLRLTFPFKDLPPNIPSDGTINDGINDGIKLNKTDQLILAQLRQNAQLTIAELTIILSKSQRAIERSLKKLQETGHLERVGSRKSGSWKVNRHEKTE